MKTVQFGSFIPLGNILSNHFMLSLTNGGIIPVHTPAVWKLHIPPRIHVFLWLLANDKLLTRDNLSKRKKIDDLTCIFCSEPESIHHLFCDCVVARAIWSDISNVLGICIGENFESICQMVAE